YGVNDPPPIQVQYPRVGIDFDHDVICRTGINDCLMVYGVSVPAEQQPARGMSQNGGVGIFYGFNKPGSGFLSGHAQGAMDGSHDEIKACQYVIRIIQAAVHQDVTFDATKYPKGSQLPVKHLYLPLLLSDSFYIQSACIKSRPTMVGNA